MAKKLTNEIAASVSAPDAHSKDAAEAEARPKGGKKRVRATIAPVQVHSEPKSGRLHTAARMGGDQTRQS